jgi:hypothetical protein
MRMGRAAGRCEWAGRPIARSAASADISSMPILGLKDWFTEDELLTCPECGARAAVPKGTEFAVCLECGAVLKSETSEPGSADER